MSQRTRAWQLLVTAILLLACKKDDKINPGDPYEGATCSNQTKCPFGYKCTNNAADPLSTGKCEYQVCGRTEPCKEPQTQCPLKVETAMCDKFNNDKYCECVRPNSEDVPSTPTTGGPTTGK